LQKAQSHARVKNSTLREAQTTAPLNEHSLQVFNAEQALCDYEACARRS